MATLGFLSRDKKLIAWELTDDETVGYARWSCIDLSDTVSDVVLLSDGRLVWTFACYWS